MVKRANSKTLLIASVLLVGIHCTTAVGWPIYVDANAPPGGDGTSWATAYEYLQDALADANSNPDPNDIWVAVGVYTPDTYSAEPNGTGDRFAAFQLISGVGLYGGFPSGGDPNWNDREPNVYETILSGDLDGNDVDVNDPRNLHWELTRAENSHHILISNRTDPNTIIDGFTITAGNAHSFHPAGGGMLNYESSLTVTNCTFSGNSALLDGGGMANHQSSSPTVTNCTFTGNAAHGRGGGMYNVYGSSTVTGCTFSDNRAFDGGGMYNFDSSTTVTGCIFSNNLAAYCGGMYNFLSHDLVVTNCTFSGNWAVLGGGMVNGFSSPTVTNCTFSGNSAHYGGGMHNWESSSPTVSNCIFWDNTASSGGNEIHNATTSAPSTPVISYSDIASCLPGGSWDPCLGIDGGSNIDEDPCFADPGYWANPFGTPSDTSDDLWVDGDYRVMPNSPCIDSGDNNSVPPDTDDLDGDGNTIEPIPLDLDGNPRIVDGNYDGNSVVDMGAYEFGVLNAPPIAEAGPNQTAYAGCDGTAQAALDGTASYDEDGDALNYYWSWTVEGSTYDANSVNPTIELPVGQHVITLVVNDGTEDSEPNEVVITVMESVQAQVKILPRAINRHSRSKKVKWHLCSYLRASPKTRLIGTGHLYSIRATSKLYVRRFFHAAASRLSVRRSFVYLTKPS
jgi:hypothetical protein